jgi:hypothetical protein
MGVPDDFAFEAFRLTGTHGFHSDDESCALALFQLFELVSNTGNNRSVDGRFFVDRDCSNTVTDRSH